MKKILMITVLIPSIGFFAEAALSASLSARDMTNIIVADNMQNQTLEEDEVPDNPKALVKTPTERQNIKYVRIVGTNAISTEEIRAIVKPYLQNDITKKAMESIRSDIKARYKKEGYSEAIVDVELIGSNLNIKIKEGEGPK